MKVYAVKHKDDNVIANSRSGGIFTALSDLFLEDGCVYGCILDESLNVVHFRAIDKTDRDKMCGSKYVQSKILDCFKQVKADLDEGKRVLFSGTSCQVSGLKKYLLKEYSNLLCVDIVCHGVPSPLLFKKYIEYMGDVKDIDFRNKKLFGWKDHVETLNYGNMTVNSKIWTRIFYSGNALRPSCYKCPFKSTQHPGDITIGDYWGIDVAAPEFDDNKGVSLVLINNSLGEFFFEAIKGNIIWKETRIEDSMQRAFIKPEDMPSERDYFWRTFYKNGFSYIAKDYGAKISFLERAFRKIRRKIRKLIKI